jgi:hypothetical protein
VLSRVRSIGIERLPDERLQGLLSQLEPQLATVDALDIQKILDQCAKALCIAVRHAQQSLSAFGHGACGVVDQ